MILIADSGSTKTDWRIIPTDGKITAIKTIGFNPYFITSNEADTVIQDKLLPFISPQQVEQLHFYGSGCGKQDMKDKLEQILSKHFPTTSIHVDTDLTGAARALCGHTPGLCGIMGTGANSCYYDGTKITINPPSLGYLLGDEGGGAHLGKMLLRSYLTHEMPHDLYLLFHHQQNPHNINLIQKLYHHDAPGRYLASLCLFLKEAPQNSFTHQIIAQNFDDFFRYHGPAYQQYQQVPFHFTGSLAAFFPQQLKRSAQQAGFTMGNIIQAPIDNLIQYHMELL